MTKQVFFVSNNQFKCEEVEALAADYGVALVSVASKIDEQQTGDLEKLARDKTLQAFRQLSHPVLIDHAWLAIECLNGMPGSLTQLFWDSLGSKLCEIVKKMGNDKAKAGVTMGFCDGFQVHTRTAFMPGRIVEMPRGSRAFQWDTIFIPDGAKETYAEMTVAAKNAISQRREAFKALVPCFKAMA